MTTLTVGKGVWRDLWRIVSRCRGGEDTGRYEPAVDVLLGREDLLARVVLPVEEALEVEEFLGDDLVLEQGQPALVEGADLELEELPLLICERVDPSLLVKLGCWTCC